MPAEIIQGGICKSCALPYAVGGPHLVQIHCLNALKAHCKGLEERLAKGKLIAARLGLISKVAWWLIDRMELKTMTLAYDEITNIPASASVRIAEQESLKSFQFIAMRMQ